MGDSIGNLFSGGQSNMYGDIAQGMQHAQDYMQKMYGNSQQQINPFVQGGQGAMGDIQKYLQGIPGQMNGNWLQNYQQSPYNKYLMDTGLTAANNAAAGAGVLGSGANQQENMQLANKIAGQGLQDWFGNNMALSNQYLQGQQGLYGGGLQGALGMGQLGADYGKSIADMMAAGSQAQGMQGMANTQGDKGAIGSLFGLGKALL